MLMFEFVQLKPIGTSKNLALNKTLKVQHTNNYINFFKFSKKRKPWLVSHPKPYIKEG